jgi:hypothetical protein
MSNLLVLLSQIRRAILPFCGDEPIRGARPATGTIPGTGTTTGDFAAVAPRLSLINGQKQPGV